MIRLGWEAEGVAVVTLDRPERRNALDVQACLDLAAVTEEVVAAQSRSLVLQGAGGHFCAGADLGAVEDPSFTPALQQALLAVGAAPLVTVAAIEGVCMGGGVQLAVAADLRVVTPAARLAVPAAKLGLAVDSWTACRLAAAAGPGEAAAMLLASAEMDGSRAYAIGFAQRLGSPAEARAWAVEVAALAPLTVRAHKLALSRPDGDPEAEEARLAAWRSSDLQEGKAAFTERRPPRFTGG